jgi:NADH-quinone oxidoreductase subunit L
VVDDRTSAGHDLGHRASDLGGHGHSSHGHGAHLHDAPAPMALALILLAAGSVLAGLVGIPHALGGGNRIEEFLAPSFEAHAVAPATEFQITEGRLRAEGAPAGQPGGAPVEIATVDHQAGEGDTRTELLLMALSSGIAGAGILLAGYFWLANRRAAANLARAATPIYALLLNKYYIDELYNAVIVQPIKQISTFVLWKGADAGLIDGAVNGVGRLVRETSGGVRRLQTGSIRAYAASLFIGVILILGWYLLQS